MVLFPLAQRRPVAGCGRRKQRRGKREREGREWLPAAIAGTCARPRRRRVAGAAREERRREDVTGGARREGVAAGWVAAVGWRKRKKVVMSPATDEEDAATGREKKEEEEERRGKEKRVGSGRSACSTGWGEKFAGEKERRESQTI